MGSPAQGSGRSAVPIAVVAGQSVAGAGAGATALAMAPFAEWDDVEPGAFLGERPAFFFDLACPLSYVAADRVERLLGDVEWVPVMGLDLHEESRGDDDGLRSQAAAAASAARLPLVWPDTFPAAVPRAMRAAAYAAEVGAGARFALAASRLAFCGGFDLDKRSALTDVAAAAGIPVKECLAAAEEEWRDEELRAAAQAVRSQGIDELPVVAVEQRWFGGVGGVTQAAAWLRRD